MLCRCSFRLLLRFPLPIHRRLEDRDCGEARRRGYVGRRRAATLALLLPPPPPPLLLLLLLLLHRFGTVAA